MFLYFWVIAASNITPYFAVNFGNTALFIFFASWAFISLIYVIVAVKDTSFKEGDPNVRLTDAMKKVLYHPADLFKIADERSESVEMKLNGA